jgi:hypothetical protein
MPTAKAQTIDTTINYKSNLQATGPLLGRSDLQKL